ncbi:LacI family DNA-binding transcriptional regulator [Alteribacillus bidgolensis]|uniref:Transcriptional regulator, LacI family n=1 Tax=Alteribacillus bidgolensis TaxID=930129 RepID=A0A1G8H320_9BACI|nr:LacI family DNA-binding transcriptional regulator [Alteribacillus bidgolensis]SDI00959.1 transcriptional regulator, LacI family [Alteribacillus bidgolensis]
MKDRVTSKDVAKKAGVSQATVSRVINKYPYIRQSTREKVLSAIAEMGFTPDQVARSLNIRKTTTIGLIVGDISNSFFAETAKVIISEARELGYDVILSNTNHESGNLKKSIDTFIGKRVDGMIIGSVERFDEEIQYLYESNFPVILYNTKVDTEHCHSVVLNNTKGAVLATEHLLGLEHEKIAYITLPLKYSTLFERMEGYKQALSDNGLKYDPELVYTGNISHQSISKFLDKLWAMKDRPTAIFAASDQIAVTVMEICKNKNIKIPEDISIIGFDDITLSSSPFIHLTTISQQHKRMSSMVVEKLTRFIEDDHSKNKGPEQTVLEPELIVRSTTKRRIKD